MEVFCRSSKTTHRFAVGTKAGFAVSVINRKLNHKLPYALHIEAVKDGELPTAFGNDTVLVDYDDGWKLVTFIESDMPEKR